MIILILKNFLFIFLLSKLLFFFTLFFFFFYFLYFFFNLLFLSLLLLLSKISFFISTLSSLIALHSLSSLLFYSVRISKTETAPRVLFSSYTFDSVSYPLSLSYLLLLRGILSLRFVSRSKL